MAKNKKDTQAVDQSDWLDPLAPPKPRVWVNYGHVHMDVEANLNKHGEPWYKIQIEATSLDGERSYKRLMFSFKPAFADCLVKSIRECQSNGASEFFSFPKVDPRIGSAETEFYARFEMRPYPSYDKNDIKYWENAHAEKLMTDPDYDGESRVKVDDNGKKYVDGSEFYFLHLFETARDALDAMAQEFPQDDDDDDMDDVDF